jgi:hypothetical protein
LARIVRRFFGKKRGARNTRSDKLGGASLGVFFAIFFLAGCAALAAALVNYTLPDWRANHNFVETECHILDKTIRESHNDSGATYRPDFHIAYKAGDRALESWTYDITKMLSSERSRSEKILAHFEVGKAYPCWYDPMDASNAVLIRGYSWFAWLILVLPLSFIAIGGAGLLYAFLNWGRSAERRSALAQRAAQLDPFDDSTSANKYPYIPGHANLVNSPGTTLAYRLPTASPGLGVVGTLLLCIFWNGIVSIPLTLVVRGHMHGEPDWIFTLLMTPFALVGIGLIVVLVRQFLVTTGVGPTCVEIDQHPLYPGRTYDVFLVQSGRMHIKTFTVSLVCDEEARYQQGTNMRIATARVYTAEILRRENFDLVDEAPYETRCQFEVPAGAMHSFKSDHNKIAWKLVVQGELTRWPNFERAYALNVYPAVEVHENA